MVISKKHVVKRYIHYTTQYTMTGHTVDANTEIACSIKHQNINCLAISLCLQYIRIYNYMY